MVSSVARLRILPWTENASVRQCGAFECVECECKWSYRRKDAKMGYNQQAALSLRRGQCVRSVGKIFDANCATTSTTTTTTTVAAVRQENKPSPGGGGVRAA